jgi:hypothetical protein
MKWLSVFIILYIPFNVLHSQCKTYRITNSGDTLNCTDFNGKKQGKWVIHLEELRGEPGFEEEGVFVNDKREGKWRRYSLMGDLQAIENYKWGEKNGNQQYYFMNELEHEESWLAMDPKKKYDTVDVPDVYDPYKIEKKIIKIQSYSLKHGVWKYYKPGSVSLIKTENYVFDSLYKPLPLSRDVNTTTNKSGIKETTEDTLAKPATKTKPKEVKDFEKKNSKKKQVQIRDGKTSG